MKLHPLRWAALLAALLLIGFTAKPCHAADLSEVVGYAAGVNGAWFDGPTSAPADIEAGGNIWASLSPHITAVGALYYGFDHSYFRWSAGGRITATDVEDRNFSVGLGLQYRNGSQDSVGPGEWAPDATLGLRPWPDPAGTPKEARTVQDHVVLGLQGHYGLTSKNAGAIASVRYVF